MSDRQPTGLTLRQAIGAFVALATLAANTFAMLCALRLFTLGEAAIALFTVLSLAAGTLWTILAVTRRQPQQADSECGSFEGSGD